SLDLGANATIEAWVKFNGLPSNSLATIASKDVGSGNQNKWILGYANNFAGIPNATFFHLNTTSGNSVFLKSNNCTPALRTWYHLAVVKSGNSYTFYRDGVADGTATTTVAVPAAAAAFLVGRAEGAFHFNGQIDDLRLWAAARTATDIQNNKNSPLTGGEPGLARYWKVHEAAGPTALDATG